MQEMSLLELIKIGGIAMWVIIAFSVISVTVAIERGFTLLGFKRRAAGLNAEILKRIYQGEFKQARTLAERAVSPLGDLYVCALDTFSSKKMRDENLRAQQIDRERLKLGQYLKARLWILGTIGATAPFVGLFGTVVGIMRSFRDMAATGHGGFTVVAEGISEALVATAGGIGVAVIAVVFFNIFQRATSQLNFELKIHTADLITALQVEHPRDGDTTTD